MLWFLDSIFLLFMRLHSSVSSSVIIFFITLESEHFSFSLSYAILAFFVCPCYFLCIHSTHTHTHTHTHTAASTWDRNVTSSCWLGNSNERLKWTHNRCTYSWLAVGWVADGWLIVVHQFNCSFFVYFFVHFHSIPISIYLTFGVRHRFATTIYRLIAITYLFIRLKITKYNLRCQLLIFSPQI